MHAVSPTDRPKSVRSCCVIEFWWRFLCCHDVFLDISVGVGAFVIRLSQISFFLLRNLKTHIRLGMSIFRICQGIALVSTEDIS